MSEAEASFLIGIISLDHTFLRRSCRESILMLLKTD